jgi:hypothetical protein
MDEDTSQEEVRLLKERIEQQTGGTVGFDAPSVGYIRATLFRREGSGRSTIGQTQLEAIQALARELKVDLE